MLQPSVWREMWKRKAENRAKKKGENKEVPIIGRKLANSKTEPAHLINCCLPALTTGSSE
jgi:hypothetical protein